MKKVGNKTEIFLCVLENAVSIVSSSMLQNKFLVDANISVCSNYILV